VDSFSVVLPFVLGAVIALIVSIYHLVKSLKQTEDTISGFKMFEQLLFELERSTRLANNLSMQCTQTTNQKLLDMYESSLKMLENIMTSAKSLDPFGPRISQMRSVLYLAKENHKRFLIAEKSFKRDRKGKPVDFKNHKFKSLVDIPQGCFFCSRPFEFISFRIVKVKLEKKPREEYACMTCRKQLRERKKVRVLHFLHDGKPVHWSKMPGYEPQENYYSLNNDFAEHKKPVLALVYSKKDDNN